MKYSLSTVLLSVLVFLSSCFKQTDNKESVKIKEEVLTSEDSVKSASAPQDEKHEVADNNENDEFISNSLFEKWKGKYLLKQEDLIDGWGRESTLVSELNLIKPDSCIFKSWLADSKGFRHTKNDNYQEFVGGILATPSKDSIEFYTKKVVSGSSNSSSPLLTLTQKDKSYFIYSLITSPPNNGLIKMEMKKQIVDSNYIMQNHRYIK